MSRLAFLLPKSLVARVYALYTATLLIFVGSAIGLFWQNQFHRAVEDAQNSAVMLIEVAAQTVGDSAVIGDYDTIQRTLERAVTGSQFAAAAFIDLQGAAMRSTNPPATGSHAPSWLRATVDNELYDVNRSITVGGHDYGILRLSFDSQMVADHLWDMLLAALGLGLAALFGGLLIIWFPLKNMLGAIDRAHAINTSGVAMDENARLNMINSVPLEFRPTFEMLNETANKLHEELGRREEALAELRSAVADLLPQDRPVERSVMDDIGAMSRTISTLVREREASRMALEQARDMAEAANRAKSEFLANMSHEIRTPMNGILGMTDLVLDTELTTEQRDFIGTVKRSADALLVIINDILDFSKIEAGKMTIESVPVDLAEAVRDALQPLEPRAREKALTLALDIAPDVPAQAATDPVRLRQILLNLIGNSIKFTSSGGVRVRCVVQAQLPDCTMLHFTVSDTGIGIAPDKLGQIFSAFSQEDNSTTRRFGGTGLGLTITRRLVELMGGEITVDSTPGQGSNFHFTLRVGHVTAPQAAAALAAQPAATDTATGTSASASLLLTEDNPVNQKVALGILKKRGYQVTVAENGRIAVERFRQQRFDLVLMDVQMPEMDGYEATAAIRELERHEGRTPTPIIAMTANAMQGDRERCLTAGMDDYITKPLKANDVYALLESVLARAEAASHPSL